MRLHTAMLAIFMIACGPTSFSGGSDTGQDFDTDTDGSFSTWDDGTQIGSEGIWGCGVDSRTTIADDTTIDGFSGTPAELLAPLIGPFAGEIIDSNAESVPTTLTLGNVTFFELVDVVESGSCADYVQANLIGSLDASGLAAGDLSGAIGIRTDEARLAIAAGPSNMTGTAAPLDFDAAEMDTIELNVGGTITASLLDGSLFFIGCVGASCTTDAPQGTFSFSR